MANIKMEKHIKQKQKNRILLRSLKASTIYTKKQTFCHVTIKVWFVIAAEMIKINMIILFQIFFMTAIA